MHAVLSGQAGLALWQDGKDPCWLLRPDQERLPATPAYYPRIFGEATDIQFLTHVSAEETEALLRRCWRQERALILAHYIMDSDFSDGTRRVTAEEFAPFADELDYVRQTLYLRPAPAEADLEGARRCSDAVPALQQLFAELIRDQALIERLHQAWQQTEAARTALQLRPAQAARRARDLGCFAAVAHLLREGKNPQSYLFDKRLSKEDPRWLTPWLSALRQPAQRPQLQREERDTSARGRERRGKQKPVYVPFTGIMSQLDVAFKRLAAHDLAFCRQIVADLVRLQDAEHLAQSLCNLAQRAYELDYYAFQLELTQQAVAASPSDGWAWAQHGHALLANAQAVAALEAYDQAKVRGQEEVGLNGAAQALLALNRPSDALDAYDAVIARFPENVVAGNGRAQVLLALNRPTDALDAYDAVIARFPENVVARNGRAQVLLALNRATDALDAYDAVIARFPQDVVAGNGRAQVLLALNRPSDALDAYDAVIARFPENVVARNGRAQVLLALNRPSDTLDTYDAVIARFPENVVAGNGRAQVLLALNRPSDALDAYDAVITRFPQDVVARTGRAQVLLALNRPSDALDAYDAVIARFPENAVARTGRAQVLLALNRPSDALDAYDAVIARFPQDVVARTGRAQVLLALNRTSDALDAYDAVIARFPQDVVAHNGRAEALVRAGRREEALTAYLETNRRLPHDIYCRSGIAHLLIRLGRPEEALAYLPESPATGDWVGFHIRGMAYAALSDFEGAERVFGQGFAEAPPSSRAYFRSAVAMLKLRRNQIPSKEELAGDDLASRTVQAHAQGLAGDRPAMQATLALIRALPEHALNDNEPLVQELEACYLAQQPNQGALLIMGLTLLAAHFRASQSRRMAA